MRKKFTLILGLLLLVGIVNVFAYSGGAGTAADPYQIANAADLVELSGTSADWNKHFILTADIDMSGATFKSIGYVSTTGNKSFQGVIDGDNHVISNLTVTPHDDHVHTIGFVGHLGGGTIKNIGIVDIDISVVMERVAAIAGYVEWGATIENCFVDGGTLDCGTKGRIGSFAGWLVNGTISNCMATNITISGGWSKGGIVGNAGVGWSAGSAIINNTVFYGTVNGGNAFVGGVVDGKYSFTNAYYASTSGSDTKATEIAAANLPLQGSYVGFDFTDSWMMTGGKAVLQFPYFIMYSGGAGTAADPYLISTVEDIKKLAATQTDWSAGYHFQVTTDIDMGGQSIGPIGYKTTANVQTNFTGTFDGNNKKISNLTVTPHADQNGIAVGMFGIISASTITNLGLHDLSIDAKTTQERVGGIVGQIDGGGSSITNCYVLGGSISGKGRVGGIVGYCASSSIRNCFTKVDIDNSWGSGGGIVGQLGDTWASGASIDDVVFYGTITGGGNAVGKMSVNGASPTVGEGYYIESAGVEDNNATKLTKLQLVKKANYPALNFSGTWAMKSGGYAYLSSFPVDNFATLVYDGPNITPVADAGANQTVNEMSQVTLSGKITDESNDGIAVNYKWTAPDGIELSDESIANPTFTAPGTQSSAVYTFTLVVNDDIIDSEPSEVKITVNNVQNYPPVADDVTVLGIGESKVTLGLKGIMDPDGDVLTYKWTAPAGIILNNVTGAHPYFNSPVVTKPTTLTFTVLVTDGDGETDTATITVALEVPPVPVSPYVVVIAFLLIGLVTVRKRLIL